MAKRYICLRCFIEYEYLCKGTQYWSPNLVAVSTIFQIFPDKYYTWGPASDLPQCITSRQRRARGGLRLRLEERGGVERGERQFPSAYNCIIYRQLSLSISPVTWEIIILFVSTPSLSTLTLLLCHSYSTQIYESHSTINKPFQPEYSPVSDLIDVITT